MTYFLISWLMIGLVNIFLITTLDEFESFKLPDLEAIMIFILIVIMTLVTGPFIYYVLYKTARENYAR